MVKGAIIIDSTELNTINDYKMLQENLTQSIGNYSNYAWVMKYYHMLFHNKINCFYSEELQKHILYGLNIIPDEEHSYVRSGQLALVAQKANLLPTEFALAVLKKFGSTCPKLYRLGSTDNEHKYGNIWKAENIIAIGWPGTGNLQENFLNEKGKIDRNRLTDSLFEDYFEQKNIASRKAGELKCFYEAPNTSIFVIVEDNKPIGIADNIGIYQYNKNSNFSHYRKCNWKLSFDNNESLPDPNDGKLTSCYEFKNPENIRYIYQKYYWQTIQSSKPATDNTVIDNNENIRNYKYQPNLNTILFGPPGTGKTFNTLAYALAIITDNDLQEVKNEFSRNFEEQKIKYDEYVEKGRIKFVTFHQSYGYEEFIEGLRPVKKGDIVTYEVIAGSFKEFCQRAMKLPQERFVFIIDEINRGNISKIFGELITLVEPTKRLGMKEAMTIALPYTSTSNDKKYFGVPNNVYIIGTMNTADRSIALLDTALRRRFNFVEIMPKAELLKDISIEGIDLDSLLKRMNERIEALYDREHTIGHSFFMGLNSKSSLKELGDVFEKSIIPLLQEYFYDDYYKIQLVLGDNASIDSNLKFIKDENIDPSLFADIGDDISVPEKKYTINSDAFTNPNAYIKIYKLDTIKTTLNE